VHAYVMQDWDRFPLLVVLKRIVDGSSSDNMKAQDHRACHGDWGPKPR
jgi:hypothetical protein